MRMSDKKRTMRFGMYAVLLVCLLLLLLTAVNTRWWVAYRIRGVGSIASVSGYLAISDDVVSETDLEPGWSYGRDSISLRQLFGTWPVLRFPEVFGGYPWANVAIAHWSIVIPLAAVMVPLWHGSRPRPAGDRCDECEYDLRGNESGICPECGRALHEGSRRA